MCSLLLFVSQQQQQPMQMMQQQPIMQSQQAPLRQQQAFGRRTVPIEIDEGSSFSGAKLMIDFSVSRFISSCWRLTFRFLWLCVRIGW